MCTEQTAEICLINFVCFCFFFVVLKHNRTQGQSISVNLSLISPALFTVVHKKTLLVAPFVLHKLIILTHVSIII